MKYLSYKIKIYNFGDNRFLSRWMDRRWVSSRDLYPQSILWTNGSGGKADWSSGDPGDPFDPESTALIHKMSYFLGSRGNFVALRSVWRVIQRRISTLVSDNRILDFLRGWLLLWEWCFEEGRGWVCSIRGRDNRAVLACQAAANLANLAECWHCKRREMTKRK